MPSNLFTITIINITADVLRQKKNTCVSSNLTDLNAYLKVVISIFGQALLKIRSLSF